MQIIKYLFDEISNYFLEKIKINIFLNIYSDIINIGNLASNEKNGSGYIFNKCNKIIFKSGIKKIVIYKNISNQITKFWFILKKCDSIVINNREYSVNSKIIWKNLIIFNENIELSIDYFRYLFSNNPHVYNKYLNLFKIDINNFYPTFRQRFFLNFLCLLNEKNKIIIFEKPKYEFDLNNKIIKEIFHQIKQKNSIFFLEANDYL